MSKLTEWTRPDNYAGPNHYDYYIVIAHHRDSDLLTESNWECITKEMEKLIKPNRWEDEGIIRDSHWAVGWIEYFLIHKKNKKAVARAEEIEEALSSYPVFDEDHYSNLEWTTFWDFLMEELDNNQEAAERYEKESGTYEGRRGISLDEIDWDVLERIKKEIAA